MTKSAKRNRNALNDFHDPKSLAILMQMLAYKRPHQSRTEKRFIETYIEPIATDRDAAGNYICEIGNSSVLWSSHLDTVHYTGGMQKLAVTTSGIVHVAKGEHSCCLGADDTAGVWLMCEMVKAGVPGLYIWHRGEELGCKGSRWIARRNPDRLDGISVAIAFDRYGTDSIITHQMGLRCCSELFATSLAPKLGGEFTSDDGGSFTDTASYVGIIPECTNISVGYYGQHGAAETLDLVHIDRLRQHLIAFDHAGLVVARDPAVKERKVYASTSSTKSYMKWDTPSTNGYDFTDRTWYDEGGIKHDTKHSSVVYLPKPDASAAIKEAADKFEDDFPLATSRNELVARGMTNLVREFPRETADFLEELGCDAKCLAEALWQRIGAAFKPTDIM